MIPRWAVGRRYFFLKSANSQCQYVPCMVQAYVMFILFYTFSIVNVLINVFSTNLLRSIFSLNSQYILALSYMIRITLHSVTVRSQVKLNGFQDANNHLLFTKLIWLMCKHMHVFIAFAWKSKRFAFIGFLNLLLFLDDFSGVP